ncbi:MAG TPA: helix-turn-helix transcriptional regulator [Aminivibrio sp.]|uniref:helix-turn-helix transcriptional regulator n=1 Tax=Aminivibrio sp. TaxID=1872489 RepID=UPI001B5B3590|nr:helix-turn-helix transcriptional regulator [Aminivibrio sp.]MBP6333447.1 transcriptional regulator [Aminivibrio sp.]MEA4952619.1 helix-turn-helix transcriptional regulator [Aminivibrio sp.]HPF85769.1 helix-turn-helix transcriptional regulator [Aminivibrio sp.]HRX26227.1 helix-turn-helix transcriptional regulator [Aminivibrio sp.]
MKQVQEEFAFFESLMKGLTAIFGTNCEVVLHDLTDSYESTVVMIENGHVTDRRVGDCGSNLGLEVLRGTVRNGDKYGYFTNTRDGRVLRSSSVYIRDGEGKVIGCLCVNFDVSNLMVADKTIRSLISNGEGEKEEEFFVNDVNQLLDALLKKAMEEVGKPVSYMTRDDKIRVVKYLDQKGAFLITKSGNRICQFLDISKFTLYSYLDEVHSEIQPSK